MSYRIALLGLIVATQIFASTTSAQTPALGGDLESLLTYARQHNVEYSAMRFEAEAADARIDSAGALPDPKFRVELRDLTKMGEQNPTFNPSQVGSTRYLLMQDLPWFGKRDLRRDIAVSEAKAAQGNTQANWVEVTAQIRQLYVQRYFLARNAKLTREVLELMQRLEQIVQQRYANGLVPQQDVIRAQVEQTSMRTELLALDNEIRIAAARLNAVLTRPTNAVLQEPEQLPPIPEPTRLEFSALLERMRQSNPLILVAGNKITAAEKNRDLAYRNRYPDFTVGVSPIQYRNAVREWEFMVEINIPLQQGARRAQEHEATAMLSAARERQAAATQRAVGDLATALSAFEAAQRTEKIVASGLLPQAELTLKAALSAYETGKADFATLLDAQRQITQSRLSLLKAQADQQVQLTEIEKLLGESL